MVFEQIATLCLSPDGGMLLAIDLDGRALLINMRRRVLLHHFSFKGPVAAASFSPDGSYIAAAVGRTLQVGGLPRILAMLRMLCSHWNGPVGWAFGAWCQICSLDMTGRLEVSLVLTDGISSAAADLAGAKLRKDDVADAAAPDVRRLPRGHHRLGLERGRPVGRGGRQGPGRQVGCCPSRGVMDTPGMRQKF